MRAEMAEQPAVLRNVLDRAAEVRSIAASVSTFGVEATTLVARGSSANAALVGRYLLEMATGRPVGFAAPSVHTIYRADGDYRGVLAIGISQSGATPDVVETVSAMRARGASVLVVTNQPDSPLARTAQATVDLAAGAEVAVPATKTVSATLLAMVLIAEGIAGRSLVPAGALDRLPGAVESVLSDEATPDRVAAQLAHIHHLLVVGRGLLLAAAREAALKLRETSGVPAEAWSAAEFRHGPIAATHSGSTALCVRTTGLAGADVRRLEADLAGRGAEVIRMNDRRRADLPLPADLPEPLVAVPAVVRGQQLARSMSIARGIDADHPLGLAKVTLV
jgi:glucosamine--fructose-6-phosphate aminotransferase (isomerizing)